MKCSKCQTNLITLYYRGYNKKKRTWIKTKILYCKNCGGQGNPVVIV